MKVTKKDFIILPEASHEEIEHPRLYVCKYRLGFDDRVKKVVRDLDARVENTATENNGRGYITDIDWKTAIRLNLLIGGKTLTEKQFSNFLFCIDSGIKGERVNDGEGDRMSKEELEIIKDEISGKRNPWRGEFLDSYYFTGTNRRRYRACNHILTRSLAFLPLSVEPAKQQNYDDDTVAGAYVDSGGASLDRYWDPAYSLASLGVREARENLDDL